MVDHVTTFLLLVLLHHLFKRLHYLVEAVKLVCLGAIFIFECSYDKLALSLIEDTYICLEPFSFFLVLDDKRGKYVCLGVRVLPVVVQDSVLHFCLFLQYLVDMLSA